MCPICLTTVALLGSAATSTGGLAALAVKKLRVRSGKPTDKASLKTPAVGGKRMRTLQANHFGALSEQ
jgi:hypothetical protein